MDSLSSRALGLATRHPQDFTLQYPPRREYFRERFRLPDDGSLLRSLRKEPSLLLYLHLPFCEHKCSYCNFAVSTLQGAYQERYVDALLKNLAAFQEGMPAGQPIEGVDIGGGTPTLLEDPLLARVLEGLAPLLGREGLVSIETTPKIAALHPERMRLLAEGGVSRVSMGVQTTEGSLLKTLRRGEEEDHLPRALEALLTAGFSRVNLDIIFGLPGQTEASLQRDLEGLLAYPITSLTTYDCLYRGKGRALTRKNPQAPSPDTYGRLYEACREVLLAHGFQAPYGSVNYSRLPGETGTSPYFEGRLLQGKPFVGLGNYATSLSGNRWAFAPYSLKDWYRGLEDSPALPLGDSYLLPPEEVRAKHALLSLSFGVLQEDAFQERYGLSLPEAFPQALPRALQEGWLVPTTEGYAVAEGAFASMPLLRSLFYTEGAVSWLETLSSEAP